MLLHHPAAGPQPPRGKRRRAAELGPPGCASLPPLPLLRLAALPRRRSSSPHPGPAPPFSPPAMSRPPPPSPPGSFPSHGHRAQPRLPGEPACSCRAAHIIAAPRPPAALSRPPARPAPSRPGSPADHGQIALGVSRFRAAPAAGVAAGPAGEAAPRGEGRKPLGAPGAAPAPRDKAPPRPPGRPRWPRCGPGARGLRPRRARLGVGGRLGGSIAVPASPCPEPRQEGTRGKARVLGQPSGPSPPQRLRERSTGLLTPFGC